MRLHHTVCAVAALIATGAGAQQSPAGAKTGATTAYDAPAELKPFDRVDALGSVRGKSGEVRRVSLRMRNWIIPNRQRIEKFPEAGLLVVQVRAGYVYTVVAGKRHLRGTDQFFTVPAGATMAVETADDSAILQVVSLSDAGTSGPKR